MLIPFRRKPVANGILDINQPINWEFSLNKGMVSEWAVIPNSGWRGGSKLYDLVRDNGHKPNDGTLSGTIKPTWQGAAGRNGGYGSLATTQSTLALTSYVDTGLPGLYNGLTNLTISFWVNANSTSISNITTGVVGQGDNSTTSFMEVGRIFFLGTGGNQQYNPGSAILLAGWHWYCISRTSSGFTLYIDARLNTTVSATGGAIVNATTQGLLLGGILSGTGNQSSNFGGNIDEFCLHNRALSASEVSVLYDQTARGNPDRWRWYGRVAYPKFAQAPVVPGVFNAAWARQSNNFIGGGVI